MRIVCLNELPWAHWDVRFVIWLEWSYLSISLVFTLLHLIHEIHRMLVLLDTNNDVWGILLYRLNRHFFVSRLRNRHMSFVHPLLLFECWGVQKLMHFLSWKQELLPFLKLWVKNMQLIIRIRILIISIWFSDINFLLIVSYF